MLLPESRDQPLWPNWIRRIPPKDEIAGSNPARGTCTLFFFHKCRSQRTQNKNKKPNKSLLPTKNRCLPGVGFEPTRTARPADLKSAPLGPSGTQASLSGTRHAHVLFFSFSQTDICLHELCVFFQTIYLSICADLVCTSNVVFVCVTDREHFPVFICASLSSQSKGRLIFT